jgi:hypothetical protein
MNKRFKGSRFDERIIVDTKDMIDAGNQFLEINISAVRENTDAIINRGDHKYNCAETSVEPGVIYNIF